MAKKNGLKLIDPNDPALAVSPRVRLANTGNVYGKRFYGNTTLPTSAAARCCARLAPRSIAPSSYASDRR